MPIKTVPTPAASIIAICGKCGKKLGGGFGTTRETSLGKALSLALGLPKPKRANVRIVETKCLKLCPKGAVAVLDGHDPGHILIVPAGTPMATLVRRLGLHANG